MSQGQRLINSERVETKLHSNVGEDNNNDGYMLIVTKALKENDGVTTATQPAGSSSSMQGTACAANKIQKLKMLKA